MQRPCNLNAESHKEPRTVGSGGRFRVVFFIPRTLGDRGGVLEGGVTQVFREYGREIKDKQFVVTFT